MQDVLVYEAEVAKVFFLVMVRISGMIGTAPILGSNNFPLVGKIGLTAFTAMLVTPSVAALKQTLPTDMLSYGLMACGEVMIGMIIGSIMTLLFGAIQVGGQILDMQSGFGMMNVFNPALETQFPIFGFFLFILAVLFLLITNGHHMMLRAIVSTFDRIPLGGFVVRPRLLWEVSQFGRAVFYDGLMIAAPVGAALLLTYLVMGLIGRVIPQVQLFVVGFPLTIGVSLLVVAFSLQVYLYLLEGMFQQMFKNVEMVIRGMA